MRLQHVLAVCFCAMALIAFPAASFADTGYAQFLGQLEQIYQLPTGILWKVALAENGGKATGCAPTSSACGMFQFTAGTWETESKNLLCKMPQPGETCGPLNPTLRNDPTMSARVAAYYLADIRSQMAPLITQAHVDLTLGLYLGYFLGTGDEPVFLRAYIQNPGQSACALLPKACHANPTVMNRSLSGVLNYFAGRLNQPGVPNVPGNFQNANGVSYAYTADGITSSDFLPANTVIPVDSQYDYPP